MHEINETHDPKLSSWVDSANDAETDFPIQNLPFCMFRREDEEIEDLRVGIGIGDQILDLSIAARPDLLPESVQSEAFDQLVDDVTFQFGCSELGILAANGPEYISAIRALASHLLRTDTPGLRENKALRAEALIPMSKAWLDVPVGVGNYTDFYASVHHATNVGSMFRPDNPLLPNYKWVPIAYHGRASSIVPSGTAIRRPFGQTKADDADAPVYGPCRLLDYELEVGFCVGAPNEITEPVGIERAEQHIFGLCLVNDWSARDIQKWEYQPLGPFLSKSFATTVSPFIVTLEALAPFRCAPFARPDGDPAPLEYLDSEQNRTAGGIDLTVEAHIRTEAMRASGAPAAQLSRGNFRDMYWTIAQMLTHHTSNGCQIEPGDLMASGTVSGPDKGARGCMLELTWRGSEPIELPGGESRKFLQDGDELILRGYCEREGFRRIGFGECSGIVEPARS